MHFRVCVSLSVPTKTLSAVRNDFYWIHPSLPISSFDELCDTADDELFSKVVRMNNHVLHTLLPPPTSASQNYNLRHRTHQLQLPTHPTQRRFSVPLLMTFVVKLIHQNLPKTSSCLNAYLSSRKIHHIAQMCTFSTNFPGVTLRTLIIETEQASFLYLYGCTRQRASTVPLFQSFRDRGILLQLD